MVTTHGISGWERSQVCRFKWIANKVSCTTSSTSLVPAPARAKPRAAEARSTGVKASSSRR